MGQDIAGIIKAFLGAKGTTANAPVSVTKGRPYAEILDFIAEHESGGSYNIVWGGIKVQHRPKKPLVQMTIQEVLDWQDSIDKLYMSEAAGKYQIMEDTLRPLYAKAGLKATDLFNEENQDKLAICLMKGRGLDLYLRGSIDEYAFCNNLAKEWASLPVVSGPKRGSSYYGGDGLNKALVAVEPFLEVVRNMK